MVQASIGSIFDFDKRMKKLAKILVVILVFLSLGYIYLRFVYLKAPDYKSNEAKAASPLDLRPAIIAKLQQLVKDGSNGLYRLTIDRINPDLIASTLDVVDATLTPDSASFEPLDQLKQVPDDVFKITVHGIHIEGIGVADLLHKDKIDVKGIHMTEPVIEVFHRLRPYNESIREKNDSLSLYHRLMKQMKRIVIGSINIEHGVFIDHDQTHGNTTRKFKDIAIYIKDVLIDSSTQNDKNRFLFAKIADMSCKDYALLTPDSLYDFKIESILISGEKHTMTASGVTLKPHGGKQHFQKMIRYKKAMFSADFPKVVLSGTNWWALMHRDKFIAERAYIDRGSFLVYLDNTLPSPPTIDTANFPDQLLMKILMPVSIAKINLKHINLTYEEFEPKINKSGFAYFDNIDAIASNVTNMSSKIKINKSTAVYATVSFMHTIPLKAKIQFDLSRYKQGVFTAFLHMDSLDKEVLNPITEPIALFTFKSGHMKEGTATVTGTNSSANGDVLLLYNNLNITPLKKKEDNEGRLKKKSLTSFIANTFVIKKNNPTGSKEPRHPVFTMNRAHHGNFFNFIWTTILTGILKTVGIPVKLGVKQ